MEIVKLLADKVEKAGGRAYYVGGYVRDRLLERENKDIDIEVHGLTTDALESILDSIGERLEFGKSFGIYTLKGTGIDVAMPRKDVAIGIGHRDFKVSVDPFIGLEKAAGRRDFTINALMEDIITGEILDFFGGKEDLKRGILKHVDSNAFSEDPLRVLRGAQFAARFGFKVAAETKDLCSKARLDALPRERVFDELEKALLKSEKPSIFFQTLYEVKQLNYWFKEVESLIGVKQNPKFHPEGDCWNHTMKVVDNAVMYREKTENPTAFMLSALCHDLGKPRTTEERNGVIHAYGHEAEGLIEANELMNRLTGEKKLIDYVLNMVRLHMKPNIIATCRGKIKSTNKLFDESIDPEGLIYLALADSMPGAPSAADFLFERLEVFKRTMEAPYVMGKDLIAAGLKPDEGFKELLDFAHKLRLAEVPKEIALKQTLAYNRKRG